ncbi:hypothetical protein KKF38_01835 [Patescibacteria group bacterium]|nr:hypothetical protein [Patescibacteria group bacterium]
MVCCWQQQGRDWKVESGKWKVEIGNWKVEIGKWKVEGGNWKVDVFVGTRHASSLLLVSTVLLLPAEILIV